MRHETNFVVGVAIVCVALTATAVLGGVPQLISYQGKAVDAGGNPVPDATYPARFNIYAHPSVGALLWAEVGVTVTTSGGLFTHLLGSIHPIDANLFADYDSLYLEVVFNEQTLLPRTPLVTSPYAFRVNSVDGALGGTITLTNVTDTGLSIIGTTTDRRVGMLTRFETDSPDTVSAIRGVAGNIGNGTTHAGSFLATSLGDGRARALWARSENNSSIYQAIGVYGVGHNAGIGGALGGYFEVDGGTGVCQGLQGSAEAVSYGASWGGSFYATAETGSAYGATCYGESNGGSVYGLHATGFSYSGTEELYGIFAAARAPVPYTGNSYGGYFENEVLAGENSYGVYGYTHDLANGYSSFGVFGSSKPAGPGSSFAGYFVADSTGDGASYGARGIGLSKGASKAYGVTGIAANRSSGTVYGGYFDAYNYGTGTKYGIYAKSPGYAGYFAGAVYVDGNFAATGVKSAAVEVERNEYRLVYSQESPECWFEDFGEGRLVNGRAHVELDPLFLQTVTIDQQHRMKVFIQLNDPACNGTAVIRGTTGFDVVELMNGAGNATFTYRVVAKRRGYEDARLEPMAGPTPGEIAAQQEADRLAEQEVERSIEQDMLKQKEESEKRAVRQTAIRE